MMKMKFITEWVSKLTNRAEIHMVIRCKFRGCASLRSVGCGNHLREVGKCQIMEFFFLERTTVFGQIFNSHAKNAAVTIITQFVTYVWWSSYIESIWLLPTVSLQHYRLLLVPRRICTSGRASFSESINSVFGIPVLKMTWIFIYFYFWK